MTDYGLINKIQSLILEHGAVSTSSKDTYSTVYKLNTVVGYKIDPTIIEIESNMHSKGLSLADQSIILRDTHDTEELLSTSNILDAQYDIVLGILNLLTKEDERNKASLSIEKQCEYEYLEYLNKMYIYYRNKFNVNVTKNISFDNFSRREKLLYIRLGMIPFLVLEGNAFQRELLNALSNHPLGVGSMTDELYDCYGKRISQKKNENISIMWITKKALLTYAIDVYKKSIKFSDINLNKILKQFLVDSELIKDEKLVSTEYGSYTDEFGIKRFSV